MSIMSQSCGCDSLRGIVCWAHAHNFQHSPAGEGAQEIVREGAVYTFPNAYAHPEPFFDRPLPERAALERRSYYANALDLVAETLAELKPEELEPRGPKLIAIIRNAAAALRGETGAK